MRVVTFFQRIKTPFIETAVDEPPQFQPHRRLVGELLQERREDLGLDLEEVGDMLRIKPAYLAALEQGRTQDLPGPTYAIGFIRAYADFLGLETASVLDRFKAEASGVTTRPDLAFPVPLGERSLPGGALVVVALIVVLCGYGIWHYLSTGERNRPERVADVPASLQTQSALPVLGAPPSQPAAAAGPGVNPLQPSGQSPGGPAIAPSQSSPGPGAPSAPTASTPPPPAGASPLPAAAPPAASQAGTLAPGALLSPIQRAVSSNAPQQPPSQAQAPPQAAGQPPAGTPASPAPAAGPNAPTPASRVAIRALTDCWIQVRATDQSIVFSRVLKSGEVYNVPARPGLSLRTGNAGALQISVDGKTAPPIGLVGTLRRDVALDPSQLAAGTAVRG